MKILNDIAELDLKIAEIYQSADSYKTKKAQLIQKLMSLCIHAETFDDGYDNPDGYGGSSWVSDVKCKICGIRMSEVTTKGIIKGTLYV